MPYPQFLAGQRITASLLNAGRMELVEQTADQSSTSATYANSEITFTPDTSARYAYWLFISYSAPETADMQWRWDAPRATFASFTQARHTDVTGTYNTASTVIFRRPANATDRITGGGGSDNSSFFSAYDSGTFDTDSVEGAITLQFAQVTANATPAILRGGTTHTRLLYQRIA